MKKLLTILCAMLLTMSAQAKDKVLDRPAFVSTASDLCPIKVVLTKKSTILRRNRLLCISVWIALIVGHGA